MSKTETKTISGILIPIPARAIGELLKKALPYVGRLLPKLLVAMTILLLSAILALSLIARDRGIKLKLDIGSGIHIDIDVPTPIYEQPLVVSTATGAKLRYSTKKTTEVVIHRYKSDKPIISTVLKGTAIHPVSFEYKLNSEGLRASLYSFSANGTDSIIAVPSSTPLLDLKGDGFVIDCAAAYANTYRVPVLLSNVPDKKLSWDFSNRDYKGAVAPFLSVGGRASLQGTTLSLRFEPTDLSASPLAPAESEIVKDRMKPFPK